MWKKSCVGTIILGYWLRNWAEENTSTKYSISDVFTHYRNHKEIRHFVERLSTLIASEVNIVDPERLFFGGVIDMQDFPKQKLEQSIREHLRKPYSAENLHITFSVQNGNTGCQGACLVARNKFH